MENKLQMFKGFMAWWRTRNLGGVWRPTSGMIGVISFWIQLSGARALTARRSIGDNLTTLDRGAGSFNRRGGK